jgi:hypothetical protein
MKQIISTIFITLLFSIFGQEKNLKKESGFEPEPYYLQKEWMYNTPGYELNKFTNHHYMGLGATVGGGLLGFAGYYLYSNSTVIYQKIITDPDGLWVDVQYTTKVNKPKQITGQIITIVGGIVSLAGIYFTLEAPIHAKRAALIMNQNGVGIKIKLNQNYEN